MIVDYPSKKKKQNEIFDWQWKTRRLADNGRLWTEEKLTNVLRAENYFENAYEAVNASISSM